MKLMSAAGASTVGSEPDATRCFRALGDTTRWRMVRLLMKHALCVCELADILGMPHSSTSSHLQVIRKAGLLESERRGKWSYYRIHPDQITLMRTLFKAFPAEAQHSADDARCQQRLTERATSCCPGPKN